MTRLILGGLAVAAAALTLAACNKAPQEPASAPEPAAAPAEAAALPADVEAQRGNAENCEHFPGEEPYDAARAKEIADAIKASCGPLKAALPGLMSRYKDDATVMATLNQWNELVKDYQE